MRMSVYHVGKCFGDGARQIFVVLEDAGGSLMCKWLQHVRLPSETRCRHCSVTYVPGGTLAPAGRENFCNVSSSSAISS